MVRVSNCSLSNDPFPLSSEIFQVIKGQIWIFLVPVFLGLVQVGLFLEQIGFFLRHGKSSHRTSLSLWILGVYPVFSLTSLIGLFIPRAFFVCSFVGSIYHSITLWKFLALIRDFFGGSDQMLKQLAGQRVSPNPFPCCCCCCLPEIAANRTNLRCMTLAVYQLSLIRTILFFVTLILWTDEKYDYGDVGYTNPNSYINVIIGISTFLSFYGYLLFYKATRPALTGYSLRSKFICIILVLVLCGLQSGILETMGAVGAIPCSPPLSPVTRSQVIYYYSLAVEMFFIGLFARYSFRRVESQPDTQQVTRHRAPQTERAQSEFSSPVDETSMEGTNPGYLPDESLCTIEHSPLDRFDFMVGEPKARQQESWGLNSQRKGTVWVEGVKTRLPIERTGVELPSTGIQVQAQVVKVDTDGITVV
ncbi:organic solute transporter subunit alpha-like isoform X1 [Sceloporus undulatus]|uniref:organic solute transporter subunit alpha-like isoform X1 n=1 Tax=Sceloporus undulatus TaxID=8520 RepID=UPI001C4B8670|nr:organic solute transporter subunit alpha-like isoform X1 [Sceloporus undulatus]